MPRREEESAEISSPKDSRHRKEEEFRKEGESQEQRKGNGKQIVKEKLPELLMATMRAFCDIEATS